MSESKRVGVGVMVLALAVVAGVGVLVWTSRSDEPAKGAEGAETAAPIQKERAPAPRPELDESTGEAAGEAKTPPAGAALHDRLGGREAIHAITGKLLEAVPSNPVIMANEKVAAAAQKVNVRKLQERLTNYICKQAGGPCKYSGRPMKDYIDQLELTSAEWDAVDEVLAAVLNEMNVPEQEAQELMALFSALEGDNVTAEP